MILASASGPVGREGLIPIKEEAGDGATGLANVTSPGTGLGLIREGHGVGFALERAGDAEPELVRPDASRVPLVD